MVATHFNETDASDLTKRILSETHRTFSAIARRFQGRRGGEHTNSSTVFRWATKGVKTPAGLIKLEAIKCGSRWITSDQAVERFIARTTAASLPPSDDPPAPRSPAARDRAATAAEAELDALGVR